MASGQGTFRDVQVVQHHDAERCTNTGKCTVNAQYYSENRTRAKTTRGRYDRITKIVVLDIEFPTVHNLIAGKKDTRIGRISVVNEILELIYDVYATYPDIRGLRKMVPLT